MEHTGLRDCVVIDTNQLLLLIACEVLQNTRRTTLERVPILEAIRGRADRVPPEQFERLWLVFQRARRKVTTQHVIAETYNLCHRLRPLQTPKDVIWKAANQLLDRDNMEERGCSIAELSTDDGYNQILHAIGPADAGLIFTAQKLKCEILSEDGKLSDWSWKRHVHCTPLKAL